MSTLQQVIFKDKILWLVAKPGVQEGPLCSIPGDYEHGRISYAFLDADGKIARFHENIGSFRDLTFTGVCQTVTPARDAWGNLLDGLVGKGWEMEEE